MRRTQGKVAVAGYGYWGPKVVRALIRLLGPSRLVVCDPRPEARTAASRAHPGIDTVPALPHVLADDSVSAVCLCTPAAQHAAQAKEALAAGKPVLVEKPVATNLADAEALVEAAARSGQFVMAGHVQLYSPATAALRRLVSSGRLGALRYLYSQRTSLGPRVREDTSVVWDYLVHDAYLLPHVLGRWPERVAAHGGAWLRPGVIDVVFARFDFGHGVFAACQAGWYDPLKVRRLVLVGSEAMALYEGHPPKEHLLVLERGYRLSEGADSFGNRGLVLFDGDVQPVPLASEEPLMAELRAFLESVEDGQPPAGEAERILRTTALLEAVDDSLRRDGQPVEVAYRELCASP